MIADVTPQQTKQALGQNVDAVYLDVRTVPEFEDGHVPGAFNIPVLIHGADGMMRFNEAFPHVVNAHVKREAHVIVGCKSGQRSAQAAEMLSQLGYTNVANMLGGFCGKTNMMGQVVSEGWLALGYTVARECEPGRSYAELLASMDA